MQCTIGVSFLDAKNDAEAISEFLLEYRDLPTSSQVDAKESERLLLWCIKILHSKIRKLTHTF